MEEVMAGNNQIVANFHMLPVEVKLKIFSYLPKSDLMMRTSLVSKHWKKLSGDSSLWEEMEIKCLSLPSLNAHRVMGGKVQLRRLLIQFGCADAILLEVANTCPKLQVVILTDAVINEMVTLDTLVQKCTHIRDIDVRECLLPRGSKSLIDIFSQCSQLQRLTLHNNNWSQAPVDISVPRHWPELREFCISKSNASREFQVVLTSCSAHLTKLDIGFKLTDPDLYSLLADCHQLNDLRLKYCLNLTDKQFNLGIGRLCRLRHLSIVAASSLTSKCLTDFFSVPEKARHIETLDLSFCKLDDSCLAAIGSHCPALTKLKLICCTKTSIEGLIGLVKKCINLRFLDIRGCHQLYMCKEVPEQFKSFSPQLEIKYWYEGAHIFEY